MPNIQTLVSDGFSLQENAGRMIASLNFCKK